MQTFVYPDEIYRELAQTSFFAAYTEEQLSQDLAQLESWGNLTAQQEVTRARNIAEFKRKKFCYQCTPYTVEIERMVERLRGLGDSFGGSLETTQFDRLLSHLSSLLLASGGQTDEELLQTWEDLMHYFRTLVENASDYLAHLPVLRTEVRRALLSWGDRCLPQQGRAVALEDGTRMRLVLGSSSARVCVHSEDGDLWLSAGLSLRLTRHSLESMSRTCVTCSASLSPCTSTTS